MTAKNVIGIKIVGDGKDLEKALQVSGKKVNEFGTRVGQDLAQSLKNLAIGASVTAAFSKFVSAADSVTVLNNRLKLATGSTLEAARAYDALFTIAQQSRVGFTELGDTFAAVSRGGQELGISQDRLLKVTGAIGNAMAISGGNAQSMQAALVQLAQGMSSGVLRGAELNSVLEQAPRLAKALADGLGVPLGRLRELGAQGQLTTQQVIGALEKSAPQLAREVQGATVTVSQAFTVLNNSAVRFVGVADDASGATRALAGALVAVSQSLDAVRSNSTALDALRTVGETVKVLWSDVAFVFERTGTEIGAIGAQIAAVLRGDFAGAAFIRRELIADAKAARAALDAYQRGVLSPATPFVTVDDSKERAVLARHRRPGSTAPAATTGGSGRPSSTSELSNLRARVAVEAQNLALLRERGLEADRLNEGERLSLQLQEQLKGRLDEKTRAQKLAQLALANDLALSLSTQARIRDDLKATADEQKKLAQDREDDAKRVSDIIVRNSEREAARIDTMMRENDSIALNNQSLREYVQEIGLSTDALERLRIARLDDVIAQDRALLVNARSIDQNELEVGQIERRIRLRETERELVQSMTDQRAGIDQSWLAGAKDALDDYLVTSRQTAGMVNGLFSNAFDGMEDALVKFVTTGKLSFTDLANSIVADITRIIVKQQIVAPLANSISGGMSSGSGFGGILSGIIGSLIGGSYFTAWGTRGMSWSYGKANGGYAPPMSIQPINELGPETLQAARSAVRLTMPPIGMYGARCVVVGQG